jgi:hypothetical protein
VGLGQALGLQQGAGLDLEGGSCERLFHLRKFTDASTACALQGPD